jgi:hypothetical protein
LLEHPFTVIKANESLDDCFVLVHFAGVIKDHIFVAHWR